MLNEKIKGVYVLSLTEDTNRKEYIENHFNEIGINYFQFFNAIPHHNKKVLEAYNEGLVKKFPNCFRCNKETCTCENNILIPQQVANFLSFVRLWEHLSEKDGLFLICEDDVAFHQGSISLLNNYLDQFEDQEKNILIRISQSGDKPEMDLSSSGPLAPKNNITMSNPAYIINGKMAKKLTKSFNKISTTSDMWIHHEMASHSDVFSITLQPLLATELSFNKEFAKFTSQIHPKGIDPEDINRQKHHIKRVNNISEYKEVLRSWGVAVDKQWNYLASEPFQMRYMLVSGILRKFKNILEIGSYKTPIFKYIEDDSKNIITIDPMIHEDRQSENQKSLMMDFRCLEMIPFDGEEYALVILGLDLTITPKLKSLIRNAEIVVIEFSEDSQWKKSREKYDSLKSDLELTELSSVHLNFDDNDFSEFGGENEWPPRTQRYVKVVSAKHKNSSGLENNNPFIKGLEEVNTSQSKLLDTNFIKKNIFPDSDYEFSHGACEGTNYLGGGLLYYTITHMLRPKLAVCLGSGGGFVPRLIRQAQRDIGMGESSRTLLIDGNMGNFGRPNWMNDNSFFKRNYDDIEIIISETGDAAKKLSSLGHKIDYLHIDADHSHEGSLNDFKNYLPLMNKNTLITFHDTKPNTHPSVTCGKALNDIKALGYDLVDMPFIGSGVAIIRI